MSFLDDFFNGILNDIGKAVLPQKGNVNSRTVELFTQEELEFLDDISDAMLSQRNTVNPGTVELFTQENIDDNAWDLYDKEEIELFIRNYIDKKKIIKISFDDKNNIKVNNNPGDKLNELDDTAMRFICSNSLDYERLDVKGCDGGYSTIVPKKIKSSNDGKYSAISYVGTEGLKTVEEQGTCIYDEDGYCQDAWVDGIEEYYLEHRYNSFVLVDNENSKIKKTLKNTDILDFCISDDSKYLIIAKKDRSEEGYYDENNIVTLDIVSLSSLEIIGNIELEKNEYCFGICVNPNSSAIAAGTVIIDDFVSSDNYVDSEDCSPKIKIYDMQTLRLREEISFNNFSNIKSKTKWSMKQEDLIVDCNIGRFKFDYSYDGNYIICSIPEDTKLYIFNCNNNTLVRTIEDCYNYDICMGSNKIAICKNNEYYILDLEKNKEIRANKCYQFDDVHTIKLNLSGTKVIIKDIKLPISSQSRCICVYDIIDDNLVLDKILVYEDLEYRKEKFLEVTSSDELLFSCGNFIYKYDLYKNKFTHKVVKLFEGHSSYEYNKLSGYLYGKISASIYKYTPYFSKYSCFDREELDYRYNEISRRVIGNINKELVYDETIIVLNTKNQFLDRIDKILSVLSQESDTKNDRKYQTKKNYYSEEMWNQRDWNEYYAGDPDIEIDPSDYWDD